MPDHRITLAVLILVLGLLFLSFHRSEQHKDELESPRTSAGPSTPWHVGHNEHSRPAKVGPRRAKRKSRSHEVIASTGTQVILDVYADRTFQLCLPDTTKDIFVVQGKDLFTSWDGIPRGVKIKIRNGTGEVFTPISSMGMQVGYGSAELGWYGLEPNHIEMPIFSVRSLTAEKPFAYPMPRDTIEPVASTSAARMSPRSKLADMTRPFSLATRQPADLEGLEFKLAFFPRHLRNARDPHGNYLTNGEYPSHETDWIDGELLSDAD